MSDGYKARTVRKHSRQAGENRAPEGRRKDPGEDANPRNKGRSNGQGVQGISKNREKEVTMLKKGVSNKTRSENIAKEIRSGKKPAQAAAIAYSVQREAKKKAAKSKK